MLWREQGTCRLTVSPRGPRSRRGSDRLLSGLTTPDKGGRRSRGTVSELNSTQPGEAGSRPRRGYGAAGARGSHAYSPWLVLAMSMFYNSFEKWERVLRSSTSRKHVEPGLHCSVSQSPFPKGTTFGSDAGQC